MTKTLTNTLVLTAPTIVTATPKDKNAITISLRPTGIFRSWRIHVGMSRIRTSVAKTIDDVLTMYAPGLIHFPGILISQYLGTGLHCRRQTSGAAIAKHPLIIKVTHKHLLIHLPGDLSLMSVQTKETFTSASIGLYIHEFA